MKHQYKTVSVQQICVELCWITSRWCHSLCAINMHGVDLTC